MKYKITIDEKVFDAENQGDYYKLTDEDGIVSSEWLCKSTLLHLGAKIAPVEPIKNDLIQIAINVLGWRRIRDFVLESSCKARGQLSVDDLEEMSNVISNKIYAELTRIKQDYGDKLPEPKPCEHEWKTEYKDPMLEVFICTKCGAKR